MEFGRRDTCLISNDRCSVDYGCLDTARHENSIDGLLCLARKISDRLEVPGVGQLASVADGRCTCDTGVSFRVVGRELRSNGSQPSVDGACPTAVI